MRFGIEQNITGASYSSTVSYVAGHPESNIVNINSLETWMADKANCTLTVNFTACNIDAICLVNVDFSQNMTIRCYSGVIELCSKTITKTDLNGLEIKNYWLDIELSSSPLNEGVIFDERIFDEPIFGGSFYSPSFDYISIDSIKIEFTSTETDYDTKIGFLWAGEIEDLGPAFALDYSDVSDSDVTISRANTPDTSESFLYRQLQYTTNNKLDFNTLRTKMRKILNTGYSTPRPFYFDDEFCVFGEYETIYGILDSGKIKYDYIQVRDEVNSIKKGQTTIGIREVF